MRVICIKVDKANDRGLADIPHPELWETVTVIDNDTKYGDTFYQLNEYSHYQGCAVWYLTENFIPVSDIDETELVSEEFKEKYLVPVK